MKVIDLLVKIANNEEVPVKIKWGSREFKYIFNDYQEDDVFRTRFMSLLEFNNGYLNDEIKIIEEKPKKIEEIKINFNSTKPYTNQIETKLNELTIAVNYLLEKESDK